LYLIQFNDDSFTILHTVQTESNGKPYCSELMDYNANTHELIVSVYNSVLLLYKITDDKIQHIRTILPPANVVGPIHGVKFHPRLQNTFVIATIHNNKTAGIYYLNLTGDVILQYHSNEWYCKDIAFIDDEENGEYIIGIFSNGKVTKNTANGYNTKIVIFRVENNLLQLISEKYIENYHSDSCVYKSGKLYLTLQGFEYGEVRMYNIKSNEIQLTNTITDLNFPHGIDVLNNKIAITSYGNISVIIKHISQ
jgi:hypothetical protein